MVYLPYVVYFRVLLTASAKPAVNTSLNLIGLTRTGQPWTGGGPVHRCVLLCILVSLAQFGVKACLILMGW